MKVWSFLVVAAMVAAYLLIGRSSCDTPAGDSDPLSVGSELHPLEITHGKRKSAASDDVPSLTSASVKVVIDTEPRRPGEMYVTHKNRIALAQGFSEFVRKSGVTQKQVNRLLLAMYDYQENGEALLAELKRDHGIENEEWVPLVRADVKELTKAFVTILTKQQYEIWWQECSMCFAYLNDPVLRLDGEEAGPP